MVNDYRVLAKQDLNLFKLCSINNVIKLMFTSRGICGWIFFKLKYCFLNCIMLFYVYYLFRI